jgi:RNA polymerase sigma factor (sigma-70 family)
MTATQVGSRVAKPEARAVQTTCRTVRSRSSDLSAGQRERLAAHDPLALQRFIELYFQRVFRFIRRQVGSEHLAEDLTQEVFLQLCKSFESYDPSRELRPWVLAVAMNKVRDHWRGRPHQQAAREVYLEEVDAFGGRTSTREDPGAGLEARETARLLAEAIAELPESMRTVLLLRVYEGRTFEELARLVGRSEVAVRKRFSRALEVLRRKLQLTLGLSAGAAL